jgi:hypothetical protein
MNKAKIIKFIKRIAKGLRFRFESNFLRCFAVFDYYLRPKNRVYDNPSVGAFYQCYQQPKSVIATLASFRKVYPTSSIYLFCDNGLDFTHVAKHFNCKYQYLSKRNGNGTTLYFLSTERVISYIKRLLIAAQNSQEDFLMTLEDDSRIYKKITKIKFDWNCIKSNHHYVGGGVTSLLKTRNSSIPSYISNMYFVGWGGAMINRKFLIDNFSDDEKLNVALDILAPYIQKQYDGGLPQDAIFTALVLYFRGTVGWYPRFAEPHYWKYKFKPFLGSIDILHNDKSFYNVPLSEDENKIFLGLR